MKINAKINNNKSSDKKKTFFNPLRIQRTAGGTPSGERVKLSDTQKKVKKKKKKLIMSYIHGKLRFLWFQLCKPF